MHAFYREGPRSAAADPEAFAPAYALAQQGVLLPEHFFSLIREEAAGRDPDEAVEVHRCLSCEHPAEVFGIEVPAGDDALEGVYLYRVLHGKLLRRAAGVAGYGVAQGGEGDKAVDEQHEGHDCAHRRPGRFEPGEPQRLDPVMRLVVYQRQPEEAYVLVVEYFHTRSNSVLARGCLRKQ